MSNEAEALLVVLVYVLIAVIVLMGFISAYLYIYLKGLLNETNEFIKLMTSLYEYQREKDQRRRDRE